MDAAATIRRARRHAGLSLRELAARAQTSHSTIAAYEAGRVEPSVATLDRIVRAAGSELQARLRPRMEGPGGTDRGNELLEVLELAGQFPARHAATLEMPPFGRAVQGLAKQ